VRNMIRSGLLDTAHDVSGGGELVALAEMALAGGLGMEYEGDELERMIAGQGGGRADVPFFGEGAGDIVVAVPPDRWDELQAVLAEAPGYDQIGTVGGDRFKIGDIVDVSLADLREAYERDLFGAPGGAEVTH
jgi:phosphoribosylformylglycinamidine (FGAM) synthase-like enzyme